MISELELTGRYHVRCVRGQAHCTYMDPGRLEARTSSQGTILSSDVTHSHICAPVSLCGYTAYAQSITFERLLNGRKRMTTPGAAH